MKKYCVTFDLNINVDKTKIFIFSRGKLRNKPTFHFGANTLDIVDEYNYLGLVFNYNAKFKITKSHLYQKGCRAMFALRKIIKETIPPIRSKNEAFRCSC